MDRTDVEIEEYEEIVGDLVWAYGTRIKQKQKKHGWCQSKSPLYLIRKYDDMHRVTSPETNT